MPAVLPSIKIGLQDDDVRAVAAASLVPVASELVSLMPTEVCTIGLYVLVRYALQCLEHKHCVGMLKRLVYQVNA